MELALDQQSVDALRELANTMPVAMSNILESTNKVFSVYQENAELIGEHSDDFLRLLICFKNAQTKAHDSLTVLPLLLKRTAENIELYIHSHPEVNNYPTKDSLTIREIGNINTQKREEEEYGQHRMSSEDVNYWYKKKLEGIDQEIENYREALIMYGVPEGTWLDKTLAKHKASMKEQASYELCLAAGYKEDAISFRKDAYPPISDYHSFYMQLVEEYKTSSYYHQDLESSIREVGNWGFGDKSFVPLLTTNQQIELKTENGRNILIFDHPFDPHEERICNQGSAFPDGPQGTCGCCACGTIINRAGGFTTERSVVEYAMKNSYCSETGGTSPEDWIQILDAAGISSRLSIGCTLSDLASSVEQGYGVIIAVSACTYCPNLYGRYMIGAADGHALVLESVIRDESTGEILEYVVSDSNGDSTDNACQRVPAKKLEKAFQRKHALSIITNDVIW